jgi:hypothetical protein
VSEGGEEGGRRRNGRDRMSEKENRRGENV